MSGRFATSDVDDLVRAEQDVQDRIGGLDVDFESLAVVSNVFRVANAARNHMERTVLADAELSFTAFTTLWVLWVWGEQEARHLAAEAGITKGTLTGVVTTLERRGLVERRSHAQDRRLVLVRATRSGQALMRRLFPRFNAEEAEITSALSSRDKRDLAHHLRTVLRTLDESSG
jgi:MarR family transcriptional regulator, organic hydroperoxide resistance regulator